jgi:hypothetical protein
MGVYFYYDDYCMRVFGIDCLDAVWDYLFSGMWEYIDNTLLGAAARALIVSEGFTDFESEDPEIYKPAVRYLQYLRGN